VFGGALLAGRLPVLGGSLLLQPAKPQIKTIIKTIRVICVLNISLQIVVVCVWVVVLARQGFTGNAVFALDPAAQVNELAAFGTEWTKGVVFPLGRFTAGWTLHESRSTSAGAKD
jgi:hypothetical protein